MAPTYGNSDTHHKPGQQKSAKLIKFVEKEDKESQFKDVVQAMNSQKEKEESSSNFRHDLRILAEVIQRMVISMDAKDTYSVAPDEEGEVQESNKVGVGVDDRSRASRITNEPPVIVPKTRRLQVQDQTSPSDTDSFSSEGEDRQGSAWLHHKHTGTQRVFISQVDDRSAAPRQTKRSPRWCNEGQGQRKHKEEETTRTRAVDPFHFNIHEETGQKEYYDMFPEPWNIKMRKKGRDDAHVLQSFNKNWIDPFNEDGANDYARWRSQIISFIHMSNATIQYKITAVAATIAPSVKNRLEVNIDYSPRGYLNLIRALEAKYGGQNRLLRSAATEVKHMEQLKPERVLDLEKYIRAITTYFQRLEEAHLEADIQTTSCFNDITDPWPWSYHREYRQWTKHMNVRQSARSALEWARERLDLLRQIPQRGASSEIRSNKSFLGQICQEQLNSPQEEACYENEEEGETSCLMFGKGDKGKKGIHNCLYCPKTATHQLIDCPTLMLLPTAARRNLFANLKLCFVCSSPEHFAPRCPSERKCQECHGYHHEKLHIDAAENAFSANCDQTAGIALKTITVKLKNRLTGKEELANCLLDSGDQRNLMSRECAERLGLTG